MRSSSRIGIVAPQTSNSALFFSASILMELAFVDRPVIIVIYCRFPES